MCESIPTSFPFLWLFADSNIPVGRIPMESGTWHLGNFQYRNTESDIS